MSKPRFSDRYLGRHRLLGKMVYARGRSGRLRVRRVRRQFPYFGGVVAIWLECSWVGSRFNQQSFERFGGVWIRSTEVCRKEEIWQ